MSMDERTNHQDRVEGFMRHLAESVPHERARLPSPQFLWLRAQWAREAERAERANQVRWSLDVLFTLIAAAVGLVWGMTQVQSGAGGLGSLWETAIPALDPIVLVFAAAAVSLLLTASAGRMVWALAR